MQKTEIKSRRGFLKKSIIAGGSIAALSGKAIANVCNQLTPAQTEGPFYPVNDQLDKDQDLTFVKNRNQRAKGEVVMLKGVVRDDQCRPIKGALVEIWQACDSGRYNHPQDPNTAALDPNFQYWGRAITNAKGEYWFKTIRPGKYRATNTWVRPPHIHMKVHLRGFEELTTQVYWKDEVALNNGDLVLQRLERKEQNMVIVDFKKQGNLPATGEFNITLKSFT